MRMLNGIMIRQRKIGIRNRDIRDYLGVAQIEDEMRTKKKCLRWFVHVYRESKWAVAKRSVGVQTNIESSKGQWKKYFVRND